MRRQGNIRGRINIGFALIAGTIAVRAAYTERTREFEAQRANDKFVSITLSVQS